MATDRKTYVVRSCAEPPPLEAAPERLPAAWKVAEEGNVAFFHPASCAHRPVVTFRVLVDREALHVRFDVQDRYVRSVRTEPQSAVCRDSCVEFFVRPSPERGYLNFEVNAGGTLLLSCIEDARRVGNGFARWQLVEPAWLERVAVAHSMPRMVEPEVPGPVSWTVACRVPLALFAAYTGVGRVAPGDCWRANLYKCADETSQPHWAAWSPIGEELNFHQPDRFGEWVFG